MTGRLPRRTRAHVLETLSIQRVESILPAEWICRWVEDEEVRARALAGLALHLIQLPRQHLYPLWQESLSILVTCIRNDFLADLRALSPIIAALGGAEAVAETFRAI